MPETAKRTARVPILGEDGRISDDYIPAAIGENVTKAESAATRAETAATAAEGSASAASRSATQAAGSATTAQQQSAAAQGSATAASESAAAAAASATTAQGHAQAAASSATQAAESAQQVADKYITGATATTLGPGEQATAQVVEQVLQLGIPQGAKGDKGDPGQDAQLPAGGTEGQVLTKTADGEAWQDGGLAPLVGTLETVTPQQVYDAVTEGRPIAIEVSVTESASEPVTVYLTNALVTSQNIPGIGDIITLSLSEVSMSSDDDASMFGVVGYVSYPGMDEFNNTWVSAPTSSKLNGVPGTSNLDNGKILQVVNRKWSAVTPSFSASAITSGTLPVSRGGTGATTAEGAALMVFAHAPEASPTQAGVVKTASDADFRAFMGIEE